MLLLALCVHEQKPSKGEFGFLQIVGEAARDHRAVFAMLLHFFWLALFGNSGFSSGFKEFVFLLFVEFISLIFDRHVSTEQ